jgi:glucose-1-phosphate thymidylyltransferase
MKALIPVAGVGSRLRPHTHTQPKAMVNVAGKPILSHIIDKLTAMGIRRFVFVIGYLGEKIQDFVASYHHDIDSEFVYQSERLGIGHAVWSARHALAGVEEVVIALGDTIFNMDGEAFMQADCSLLCAQKVKDPRLFGVAEVDEANVVLKVMEKPAIPKSNIAMVGVYKIREVNLLIECLEELIAEETLRLGEFQLTDALQMMISKGAFFRAFMVSQWFDCGKKEALLETNATLLNSPYFQSADHSDLHNSIIIKPVHIADGCQISNSIIGPNVSIGDHAMIEDSIIKDSIIGSYAKLSSALLKHSVIGSDATLTGPSQSLNLGDNNEVSYG